MRIRNTRAGKLRFHGVVNTFALTYDGYGQQVQTPILFANRFMGMEPISGNESFWAKQVMGIVTHAIAMRHLEGVTPKMQIVVRGRTFEIVSAINVEERDRQTVCLCKENV